MPGEETFNSPEKIGAGTDQYQLGSTPGSQPGNLDKVNVVVTTAEQITMVDDPTYVNLVTLQNKIGTFLSQGTMVYARNHLTPNCKQVVQMILNSTSHANRSDWETLPVDDFFRVLLEIFPKNTAMQGLSTLQYLTDESTKLNFDFMHPNDLAKQFVAMQSKLDIDKDRSASDEAFAIKQLTRDIPRGKGKEKAKKFLESEISRIKPATLKAFFEAVLKTQHDTRKAVLEVDRRGVTDLDMMTTAPNPAPPMSTSGANEPTTKKPRIQEEQGNSFCSGCGRSGHGRSKCGFLKFEHPDRNLDESKPWRQSSPGIKWLARGFNKCPLRKTLDGQPYDYTELEKFVK